MIRRPPISTRTDPLFPYTTLFRSQAVGAMLHVAPALPADARMPRGHDLDAIAAAITPATRLVYLANPNNPTGTWFSRDAFAAFVARVPDATKIGRASWSERVCQYV